MDDPNHEATPPVQPPRAVTSASQARIVRLEPEGEEDDRRDPGPGSTASTRSSASASEIASGFSSSRCFPARAAAAAMGACTSGGTANATPSTAARNAAMSSYGVAP